jgi:hypothetical protein
VTDRRSGRTMIWLILQPVVNYQQKILILRRHQPDPIPADPYISSLSDLQILPSFYKKGLV